MPPVVPPSTYAPLEPIGTDIIARLVADNLIRTELVNGEPKGSIVDLVDMFVDDKRDARKWWNENKKRIIGSTTELSETIGQLKMLSSDGKRYKTDVAPLWAFIWILARIDTPKANAFMASYFKSHANHDMAIIRQRFINIAQGMERNADSIHEQMKRLDPVPDSELNYWEK